MKSSRSKKTGLSTLTEDGSTDMQATDTSSKSSGGFTSFFGRSKRSKSPTPNMLPNATDMKESLAAEDKTETHRISMNSRHYKTLSRSMNDLGTLINGSETREPIQTRLNTGGQFSPRKSLDAQMISPQMSPTKRKTNRRETSTPFPPASITTHGWLSKRGSKKEYNMKLYYVYVCLKA